MSKGTQHTTQNNSKEATHSFSHKKMVIFSQSFSLSLHFDARRLYNMTIDCNEADEEQEERIYRRKREEEEDGRERHISQMHFYDQRMLMHA